MTTRKKGAIVVVDKNRAAKQTQKGKAMMTAIFAAKNFAYYLHDEYYETLHKEEYQQGHIVMRLCRIGKSEKL